MNAKIKHVLFGFKNLTEDEKKEFFEIIKNFEDRPYTTDSNINESIGVESITGNRKFNDSTVNFGLHQAAVLVAAGSKLNKWFQGTPPAAAPLNQALCGKHTPQPSFLNG